MSGRGDDRIEGANVPSGPNLGETALPEGRGVGLQDWRNLLSDAKFEIEQMRRRMEVLQAKVEAFELMGAAVVSVNPNRQGMGYAGPDIAWKLQDAMNRLDEEAAKQKLRESVAQKAGTMSPRAPEEAI